VKTFSSVDFVVVCVALRKAEGKSLRSLEFPTFLWSIPLREISTSTRWCSMLPVRLARFPRFPRLFLDHHPHKYAKEMQTEANEPKKTPPAPRKQMEMD